ncbi:MAG: hypothetical protein RLZZ272_149 [Actinomycetota bacterium]
MRGVLTRPEAQLVLLDTPGLSRPRSLLSRRMNQLVRESWSSVDVVVLVVDLAAGIGEGDRFLAEETRGLDTPVVAVANKIDRVRPREALIPELVRLEALRGAGVAFDDVVPVSAGTAENVERLVEVLIGHLPEGPRIMPPDLVTDQPDRVLAAEIVRERVMHDLADELPHSVAVTVDGIEPDADRDDLVHIDAVIHVERESQRPIIIGRGGERLKRAGTEARLELERLLGVRVHLTTHVKVAPDWQRDPRQLGRFGL